MWFYHVPITSRPPAEHRQTFNTYTAAIEGVFVYVHMTGHSHTGKHTRILAYVCQYQECNIRLKTAAAPAPGQTRKPVT